MPPKLSAADEHQDEDIRDRVAAMDSPLCEALLNIVLSGEAHVYESGAATLHQNTNFLVKTGNIYRVAIGWSEALKRWADNEIAARRRRR